MTENPLKSPPRWLDKLLEWFCPDELLEEVQGDLHERYYLRVQKMGEKKARQLYFKEVLAYKHSPFIKGKTMYYPKTLYIDMLQHSLLLIYRNFKRFKSSFFINLIGLSTGLACTLLIYLWVNDELKFDKFHENDSQLYEVMRQVQLDNEVITTPSQPGILAKTLAEEMPEVEYAATGGLLKENKTIATKNTHIKASGIFAGNDYFNIFSYSLLEGDKNNLFPDDNSIVISEELATKLFNSTQNIVGKTLELPNEKRQLLISGVYKNIPFNSSTQFDFVLSHEALVKKNPGMNVWPNNYIGTYVVLKKGTDISQFNKKIAHLIERKSEIKKTTLFARPYSERYLYNTNENGVKAMGRIMYVKLFSIIAIFILFIACINFMNLSTAKASRRLKEVGVKKALGANRQTLIYQYLGESILMTAVSLLLALLLVVCFLPQFNEITGKELTLYLDTNLIISLLGITLITGFIAGSYPALYLSGFNPIAVLKGKLNTSVGEVWARKGLVVFQFALSVIFIVSVLVVYKQIEYVQSKNLGYTKENIIYFQKEGWAAENLDAFLAEIKNVPGVTDASSMFLNMFGISYGSNQLKWEGKKPEDDVEFKFRAVNYGLIEMLDIKLAAGRSFSKEFGAEDTKIIFNEAAIAAMGLKDPIGKTINLWGKDMQIVGIVKNFHFESLHTEVEPLFIQLFPQATENILLKIEAGKEKETIDKLQQFYQKFNPGFTLDYKFLDQEYQAQYVAEQRVSALSQYFAGLAILISCLGLFGLVAFTAERRRKEMGIRKVLGSSEWGIIYLLSSDFTKMVLVSIIIALPVSYLIASRWLENFAYSIDLEWWYFIGAGLAALLIAWLTVGMQAVKASRINPIESLRDE